MGALGLKLRLAARKAYLAQIIDKPSAAVQYLPVLAASYCLADVTKADWAIFEYLSLSRQGIPLERMYYGSTRGLDFHAGS